MRVVGLPRVFYQIARHMPPELSAEAQERLRWLSAWETMRQEGIAGGKAGEALGLSRSSVYRWRKRLKRDGLKGLETSSRRPWHRRGPTWSPELALAVLKAREEHCPWGKDKLVVLLRREGWRVSTSMVGRILGHLKKTGQLKEPSRRRVVCAWHRYPRPYAVRKPKDHTVQRPGDLVQVDTLDVRPLPGVVLKHFTARDVITRWDVIDVHTRATAPTAAHFLETVLARIPFPIRAIQVDGGSEYQAAFEEACQRHGIKLFVLPPRSPKLNGSVERAQRTHSEEFYQVYDGDLDVASVARALHAWEHTYNHVRPHHALDGRTPAEYLIECHPGLAQNLQLP